MPIYFRFFSAKEYDSISVDGSVISADVLKRKIFQYKYKSNNKSASNGLCLGTDLDLVVINSQTNDCYVDDMLIPNNTHVLIRRVPGTRRRKPTDTRTLVVVEKQQPLSSSYRTSSSSSNTSSVTASSTSTRLNSGVSASTLTSLSSTNYSADNILVNDDGFGDDVFLIPRTKPVQSSMSILAADSDEDSKIKALVSTPALDWQLEGSNGAGYGRMDSHGFGGLGKKTPPHGYVCHRCKVPGHFIQHCPTNGDPNYDIKRLRPPTGIPKSMLVPNPDGSYVLSNGATAVMQPNHDDFEKEIGCFPSKRSQSASDLPQELRAESFQDEQKTALDNVEDGANKRKLVDASSVGGKRKKGKKGVEDEVQQKLVSESYLMPVPSFSYSPYWPGVQMEMVGYMAPYYAAGAMNYGLSPFGTVINGGMNQASYSMLQMGHRQ